MWQKDSDSTLLQERHAPLDHARGYFICNGLAIVRNLHARSTPTPSCLPARWRTLLPNYTRDATGQAHCTDGFMQLWLGRRVSPLIHRLMAAWRRRREVCGPPRRRHHSNISRDRHFRNHPDGVALQRL